MEEPFDLSDYLDTLPAILLGTINDTLPTQDGLQEVPDARPHLEADPLVLHCKRT